MSHTLDALDLDVFTKPPPMVVTDWGKTIHFIPVYKDMHENILM